MKKVFCDACGQQVDVDGQLSEYIKTKFLTWFKLVISAVIENDPKYGGSLPKSFDMCIDCAKKVIHYIEFELNINPSKRIRQPSLE